MWVEHVQCGYWVGGTGESTNLLVKDCRFRNTGADGVNMCNGNLNGLIVNCHARGTGDDAFAIWSATDLYPHPCTNNTIRNCTAELPWRAACFAIYGGDGNRIENCVAADALTYPGLTVSSEFNPYPLDSATVDGLSVYRCGATYWDSTQQFGAVWLFSPEQTFNHVTISNVDIIDPTYQGIHIQSAKGGAPGYPIQNTLFQNITISNPTTFGVQIRAGSLGGATFKNVVMTNNIYNVPRLVNQSSSFTVSDMPVKAKPASIKPAQSFAVRLAGSRMFVDFAVPQAAGQSRVKISLFTMNGKKMATLCDAAFAPGSHRVTFDRNASIGMKTASCVAAIVTEIAGDRRVDPVVLR
jgi:hypothetical protein